MKERFGIKKCSSKFCFSPLQNIEYFDKDITKSDGLSSICKNCTKIKNKNYRDKNKNKIYEYRKFSSKIQTKEKQCSNCLQTQPFENFHKDSLSKDNLSYSCKNCSIQRAQEHYKLNKEKKKNQIKARRNKINERKRNRRKIDIQYKLECILRSRFHGVFKGGHKTNSFIYDLGCTIADLKNWIEQQFYSNPTTGEQMSWDNYGQFGWHIDHIIPLCSVDLQDRKQFLKVANWFNLRPLWAEENLNRKRKNVKVF